ncbi:MAG TPA: hypothetical protein VG477_11655 [Thermoanaerobaculia bacterium]|nr:hypothetical protein [Thermoanaerobaculia bacterium]
MSDIQFESYSVQINAGFQYTPPLSPIEVSASHAVLVFDLQPSPGWLFNGVVRWSINGGAFQMTPPAGVTVNFVAGNMVMIVTDENCNTDEYCFLYDVSNNGTGSTVSSQDPIIVNKDTTGGGISFKLSGFKEAVAGA